MLNNDKLCQVQSNPHRSQSYVSANKTGGSGLSRRFHCLRLCFRRVVGRPAGPLDWRTRDSRLRSRRWSDGVQIPSLSCLVRTALDQCRPLPSSPSTPVRGHDPNAGPLAGLRPNVVSALRFLCYGVLLVSRTLQTVMSSCSKLVELIHHHHHHHHLMNVIVRNGAAGLVEIESRDPQ